MATIHDVAKAAGVSIATVSRVARQPGMVAKETRLKVQAAIDALGYAANPAAASLRTLRTGKIIVTVPNIANPFFSKVFQGIEQVAMRNAHAVLLGNTADDPEIEDRYADMLRRKEADGMIFLESRLPEPARRMVEKLGASAPIVGACEFDPAMGISGVRIDNQTAAADAMRSLYDLGHRNVAVLTGPEENPLSKARLAGVRHAADSRGAADGLIIEIGDFSSASGLELASKILAERQPTAFFCFSDELAFGAMAALRNAGLDCPSQVSVIGFDDVDMAAYVHPPLTTIGQPMQAIGAKAAQLLFDILDGKQKSPQSVTLPHSLVSRESVAPPPG